ncbi:DoxX family protein [Comamonas testosteroni]|uniref:DoxX family protein n=1 Tax=Comamonas testosteroni TaxID=285 RepID=A0A373FPY9_COMTE|nr:DoxX family protein [Comamonas testosteroni]RGE46213.1 DoxX family protein [Comamonas testosteroni]
MKNALDFNTSKEKLWISSFAGFYNEFAQPIGWLLLRLLLGGWLLIEGWPKLMNPMGQVAFVEMIGFHPGWFFSPLLAVMQVVGGICLVLGLLTRPMALANAVMLMVTVWFHFHFPYDATHLLTSAGIEAVKSHAEYITPNGAKRLFDGGAATLELLQHKAIQLSSIWAAGCLFFAAFGGGLLSVDRLLRKEF